MRKAGVLRRTATTDCRIAVAATVRKNLFLNDREQILPIGGHGIGVVEGDDAGAQPRLALRSSAFIQLSPRSSRLKWKVFEVDDVAVMGVGRAIVDLLASNVGEDALGVARILGDQLVH